METSYTASSASPAVQLPTNRSLLKFILLSIITLGIYGLKAARRAPQFSKR